MKTLSTADWVLEKRFITTMLSSLQSFPRVIGQIETIVCLLVNLMVSCNCMEMNLECFYIVVIITTVTVLCAVVLLVFNDQTFSVYQYCRSPRCVRERERERERDRQTDTQRERERERERELIVFGVYVCVCVA
jgi:Na+/melibiose symporter-like transporter